MQNWIWERICFGKFYPPGTPSKSNIQFSVKNDFKMTPKMTISFCKRQSVKKLSKFDKTGGMDAELDLGTNLLR